MAQLRKEKAVPIPTNPDSVYKPITRAPKVFGKLVVPKKLQEALPFASKPKMQSKTNKNTYMAKRSVVVEPGDRKARAAVQMLATIKNDKVAKRKEANQARSKEKQKALDRQAAKFADVHAEAKKRKYRDEGKEQLRREQKKARKEH